MLLGLREGCELSTARKFSLEELRDPWVLLYEIGNPFGGPIPFPSALNKREVDRAARAIVAGRSPGVKGWINTGVTVVFCCCRTGLVAKLRPVA